MRTGLGRGLDVLLGQTATEPAPAGVGEIPLEKVLPNPQQPRTSFPADEMEQLAASIRAHGVLQPIVVSRRGDRYELVAGHRRVLAARLAGRTSIPAVVRDEVTDRLELALVENLQRADLNAIEAARAYKLLMEAYGLTQEQLADRLGRSRASIANTLRSLSAPQVLQDAVSDGRITEGHLRALLPLSLSDAVTALGEVLAKDLSVRETEAMARRMSQRRPPDRRAARGVDPQIRKQVAELRAALGTKVHVDRGSKGGRITIEFYSDEELERLYELLLRAGREA